VNCSGGNQGVSLMSGFGMEVFWFRVKLTWNFNGTVAKQLGLNNWGLML